MYGLSISMDDNPLIYACDFFFVQTDKLYTTLNVIFCTTYNSKMEKGQALDFLWIEIFLNAFVVLIMILRITSKIEWKGREYFFQCF